MYEKYNIGRNSRNWLPDFELSENERKLSIHDGIHINMKFLPLEYTAKTTSTARNKRKGNMHI